MKTKIKIFFLLIAFISGYGFSADSLNTKGELRHVENKAFKEGEKLTFELNYGIVTAGIAVMQIPQIKKISGREAYHITFEVNSVPSFDWKVI